ncbi:MAG TPA: 16S rRNA processing protein RimM [Candidatus Desulfofervidus auxilii]|uniref:Ribosome maturation factor RimM n=1 Tax=Desulfofervidus auxilii TaxID=1621989 RepID=A0A7V0IA83_DESA2|nr:16S rRNA processing protein RimM [Candidatus Desulfofervidus auxilii]
MIPMEERFLLIGKITKTHGIKGEVRVVSFTESVDTFRLLKEVYIKKGDFFQKFQIKNVRPHKNICIVAFEGINKIEDAQTLIGGSIYCDKSFLPPITSPDEYYWHEVIGLEVRLITGEKIGKIKNVFNTGSNDIFVVYNKREKKEYLIPSIEDTIEKFDWERKILWIKPLAGLLD